MLVMERGGSLWYAYVERSVYHVAKALLTLVVGRREGRGQDGQEEAKGKNREAGAVHFDLLDERSVVSVKE